MWPRDDEREKAPDHCRVAVVLVDVIDDLGFPGGERLLPAALAAAGRIRDLVDRARAAGVPVIFANDHFGRWREDFHAVLERALRPGSRGRPIAELLRPAPEDYFVLEPKHSAFFATPLEVLLGYLGARTLVLAGFSGNMCLLYTAVDATMRGFEVLAPADCTASLDPEANRAALEHLACVAGVATPAAAEVDFGRLTLRHPEG